MAPLVKDRILKICDELGEEIDSPNCQALRTYIKTCPNCQAFVDSVQKTIKLYRVYQPEYSDRVRRRLFKALKLQSRSS